MLKFGCYVKYYKLKDMKKISEELRKEREVLLLAALDKIITEEIQYSFLRV
mgnify:CR=1 FL=1